MELKNINLLTRYLLEHEKEVGKPMPSYLVDILANFADWLDHQSMPANVPDVAICPKE